MNVMTKEFVLFEEALALIKLNFDNPCFGFYENFTKELNIQGFQTSDCPLHNQYLCKKDDNLILAPSYQQAFKFFRDKYNLQHELISAQKGSWLMTIQDISKTTEHGVYNGKRWDLDDLDDFNNLPHTYEQAELACLKKLIEIVESKA